MLLGRDFNGVKSEQILVSMEEKEVGVPSRRGGTFKQRVFTEKEKQEFDVNKLVFGYTQQSDLY